MVLSEKSSSYLSEYALYKIKKKKLSIKINVYVKMKNCRFLFEIFFKLFPKFGDLINSDTEKSHQNLSDHIPFLFKKWFEFNKRINYF